MPCPSTAHRVATRWTWPQGHRHCGLRIADCGFPSTATVDLRRRRGFTLVELTVSIAITSVLMLAMGSAMLVASRAVPDARSPAGATVYAPQAVEQLVTELQYATSIASRS